MSVLNDHMSSVRDEVIPPIREEAGWPEHDDEPVNPDVLNRYIELLEAKVVGTIGAMHFVREVGRG